MQVKTNTKLMMSLVAAALVVAVLAPESRAQAKPSVTGDAYPLEKCIVTGEKLGSMGKPVVLVNEGRELRFCCKMCVKKFNADAARYLKKLDEAIIKEQKARYPLSTCVVEGDALKCEGCSSGAVDLVYGNRYFRLCCKKCLGKFKQAPQKYLKRLNEAVVKAQLPKYPLATCVVAGGKLGGMGDPVNYVHANRLVRFCCAGCIKSFRSDPRKYMAKLQKSGKPSRAAGDQSEAHKGHGHEGHGHQGH